MRTLFFALAFCLFSGGIQAQDYGLYWKYKDYDGALAISVPRWATFLGTAFVGEKADRKLMRKVHKVRVLFFEGGAPFTDRDMKRFARKAKRRHLDELVTVRSGKTDVRVLGKTRGSTIRKLVFLFRSPEGAGLVTVKGKLRMEDINKVIKRYEKEDGQQPNRDDKSKKLPKLPSVPVMRV